MWDIYSVDFLVAFDNQSWNLYTGAEVVMSGDYHIDDPIELEAVALWNDRIREHYRYAKVVHISVFSYEWKTWADGFGNRGDNEHS